MALIDLKNIHVSFQQGKRTTTAVQNESLAIERGDVYGIVGYSGAGKSTLVRTINLLQKPTSGSVIVDGTDMLALSPKALREKRQTIGMIFQHFNLLDEITVAENIAQPLLQTGLDKAARQAKVAKLLELVELQDHAEHYPSQLSGGQKQRVAIARALANDPEILISDEATSALDPRTTNQILKLLKELNAKLNLTIVMITHEMDVVKEIATKVAVMENGAIIERGSLLEIFTRPQKPLTQTFINTATKQEEARQNVDALLKTQPLTEHQELARIEYVGNDTSQPLLSTLYADFGVTVNILYSNMEILTQVPVGLAIVIFDGPAPQRRAAKDNLIDHGVNVTPLTGGQN